MIVSLVALTVGWVLLAAFGALADNRWATLYWTLLTVGTMFLAFVLFGVVAYLTLSVETISLNRRQSNFIDSVTHELKSPIASLKLYLQTLGCRKVSEQEQQAFFRTMLDDVDRLDTLINHLLDVARLDQHASESELEDVRVDDILAHCAAAVCIRYRVSPGVVQLDVEPAMVRARPVDVDLIFRNVIDNGVKYAGSEPRVEVTARLHGGNRYIVQIGDNGQGIPLRLRRRIFRRFSRHGEELEREKPGLGLGLYLVRILVRRLAGSVRVRDREEGKGAVFEVDLPARAVPPSAPTRTAHGSDTADENVA